MESGRALLKGAAASNVFTTGVAAVWATMFFAGRAAHHGTSLPPIRTYKLGVEWPHCYILPKKDK